MFRVRYWMEQEYGQQITLHFGSLNVDPVTGAYAGASAEVALDRVPVTPFSVSTAQPYGRWQDAFRDIGEHTVSKLYALVFKDLLTAVQLTAIKVNLPITIAGRRYYVQALRDLLAREAVELELSDSPVAAQVTAGRQI